LTTEEAQRAGHIEERIGHILFAEIPTLQKPRCKKK